MSEEIAKAVKEVAKTTGKGIDLVEKLGGLFKTMFGGVAEEIGGTLQDWAKFYRWQNLLRLQDKVEGIRNVRNLEGKTKPIPLKYAIPILEKASLEEDDTLQDMWAGLVANATDPNKRLDLKRVFSDVLSSLEPIDVQVLKHLGSQGWLQFRNIPGGGISVDALVKVTAAPETDVQISLQNLHRLGLIVDEFLSMRKDQPFTTPLGDIGSISFGVRVVTAGTTFRPSPLGHALLKACEA